MKYATILIKHGKAIVLCSNCKEEIDVQLYLTRIKPNEKHDPIVFICPTCSMASLEPCNEASIACKEEFRDKLAIVVMKAIAEIYNNTDYDNSDCQFRAEKLLSAYHEITNTDNITE